MGRGLRPRLRLVFNPQDPQDRRRDSCKWSSDLKIHTSAHLFTLPLLLYTQREKTEGEREGRRERGREKGREGERERDRKGGREK